jgi:hypothetical protein
MTEAVELSKFAVHKLCLKECSEISVISHCGIMSDTRRPRVTAFLSNVLRTCVVTKMLFLATLRQGICSTTVTYGCFLFCV